MPLLQQKDFSLVLKKQLGKQELKDQFVVLRAKDWGYVRIAKKLQVSNQPPPPLRRASCQATVWIYD